MSFPRPAPARSRHSALPAAAALAALTVVAASALLAIGPALAAQNPPAAQHAGEYSQQDIQSGSVVYGLQCAQCHGPSGDQVGGVDLRTGRFRHATSDDDLRRIITNGIPGTSMPGRRLDPAQLSALVAYVRNIRDFNEAVVALGDAGRGRGLYDGNGCAGCHRIGASGSRAAPDLSEIGSTRSPAAIQQSLLNPTSMMMPINRPVRLVTKDGRTINGRRLNEDTYTMQLMTDQEDLMTVLKSDLKELRVLATSPMPSYKDTLTPAQLADLVAYLASHQVPGRATPPAGQGSPAAAGPQRR
jgi:putative heme-binding domain-containing protein